MARFAWIGADGGVHVTVLRRPEDRDAAIATLIRDGRMPPGTVVVDEAPVPRSRRFRNAWRLTAGRVAVDLPLARGQRMGEIRAERNQRLDASDKKLLQLREIGTPAQVTAYLAFRQALRDVPATEQTRVDVAASPDDLAAHETAWPVEPA